MPADFDRCVKEGGKVRTIKLPAGKYRGEVKTKKQERKK